LPGLGGREVAERLRNAGSGQLGIIAVTAMQPSRSLTSTNPGVFALSTSAGLGEEETLLLIRSCLQHVRPAYVPELPTEAS